MSIEYDNLICYKQISIDNHGKLKFFLEKHSTKEGTWGKLSLNEGEIDFIFQNGLGQELSRIRLDKNNRQLSIPPASWHKIIPINTAFDAQLEFYCKPHRYFNKKYGLTEVHRDLLYVYHTYLSHLGPLTTLDVGCASDRNLLYLAQLGHYVKHQREYTALKSAGKRAGNKLKVEHTAPWLPGQYLSLINPEGTITLVHGGVTDEDIYHKEELEMLSLLFSNFRYDPCVLHSQELYPEGSIEKRVLAHLHSPNTTKVYVYGPKETTNKLKTRIFLADVPSANIYSDIFL